MEVAFIRQRMRTIAIIRRRGKRRSLRWDMSSVECLESSVGHIQKTAANTSGVQGEKNGTGIH